MVPGNSPGVRFIPPFLITSSYVSGSCIGKCLYSGLLFIFAATGKRDILPRPMKGIRKTWEEFIISPIISQKIIPGKELKTTMTDKGKGKAGKAEYTEANVTAQTMTKDPGVKAQHGSGGTKVVPHNRDRALLPHQSARRN